MDHVSHPPSAAPLPGRRTFFSWLTYGVSAATAVVLGLPVISFLLGARRAPVEWVPLGPVKDFPLNQTRMRTFTNPISVPWDGMVAHTGLFVRNEGLDEQKNESTRGFKFLILAVNCAHLGCPVEWFQESGLFMCPCHGGVYYANGEHASGPPPRGLYPYVYRVVEKDGVDTLEVQAPHYPTLQNTLDPADVTR